MILYLIHDLQKQTYSHPLVGPDLATVNQSLLQLNPENLSDLTVLVLDTLETLEDLTKLRVQRSKYKLKKDVTVSVTPTSRRSKIRRVSDSIKKQKRSRDLSN